MSSRSSTISNWCKFDFDILNYLMRVLEVAFVNVKARGCKHLDDDGVEIVQAVPRVKVESCSG